MAYLMRKLWRDDCGALISAEFLFVSTILVIGVIIAQGRPEEVRVNPVVLDAYLGRAA